MAPVSFPYVEIEVELEIEKRSFKVSFFLVYSWKITFFFQEQRSNSFKISIRLSKVKIEGFTVKRL